MKFIDWFYEVENYCLRSERFYDSLTEFRSQGASFASIKLWLESAYNAGKEQMKEEAVKTAEQYLHKMDAGKEHIIVALKELK